jgi:hypothetical protein
MKAKSEPVNKRNIAVDANGKEIAFDLRKGPPSGYTPLFPPPEVLDNVQNVTGVAPSQATSATESNGQVAITRSGWSEPGGCNRLRDE